MERCGLCLQDRPLRKSHLMPKALYKIARGRGVGLVYASRVEGSRYTDEQIAKPFLCDDCEGMLSRKGEQIVCRECYRGKEGFILQEKLRATGKDWMLPQVGSNTGVDFEAYLYFGASVIWRASAGKWPKKVGRMRKGLGEYEERIRKYLVGETDFPKNVSLLIGVNMDKEEEELGLSYTISFPFYEKQEGHHDHIFYIPGVNFTFKVGKMSGEIGRFLKKRIMPIMLVETSFNENKFFKTLPEKMLEPKGRLEKDVRCRKYE